MKIPTSIIKPRNPEIGVSSLKSRFQNLRTYESHENLRKDREMKKNHDIMDIMISTIKTRNLAFGALSLRFICQKLRRYENHENLWNSEEIQDSNFGLNDKTQKSGVRDFATPESKVENFVAFSKTPNSGFRVSFLKPEAPLEF